MTLYITLWLKMVYNEAINPYCYYPTELIECPEDFVCAIQTIQFETDSNPLLKPRNKCYPNICRFHLHCILISVKVNRPHIVVGELISPGGPTKSKYYAVVEQNNCVHCPSYHSSFITQCNRKFRNV